MRITRHLVPWLLLTALQLGDIATTAIALNTRAATEGNRTAAALMTSYGQPFAYTTKAVGIAIVLFALWHYRARRWAHAVMVIALTLSTFAVLNNVGFLLSSHP